MIKRGRFIVDEPIVKEETSKRKKVQSDRSLKNVSNQQKPIRKESRRSSDRPRRKVDKQSQTNLQQTRTEQCSTAEIMVNSKEEGKVILLEWFTDSKGNLIDKRRKKKKTPKTPNPDDTGEELNTSEEFSDLPNEFWKL